MRSEKRSRSACSHDSDGFANANAAGRLSVPPTCVLMRKADGPWGPDARKDLRASEIYPDQGDLPGEGKLPRSKPRPGFHDRTAKAAVLANRLFDGSGGLEDQGSVGTPTKGRGFRRPYQNRTFNQLFLLKEKNHEQGTAHS